MKKLFKISRAELLREMENQNKVTSDMCQRFIDCNRGHETMAVIRLKTDKLSINYIKAMEYDNALSFEHSKRLKYHGKLTPISLRNNMLFNPYTICVLRSVNGKLVILPLFQQNRYKEYNGCFSMLKCFNSESEM